MIQTLSIRRSSPDDHARLLHIWRAASEQAHGFFTAAQLDAQQKLVSDVYLTEAENWVAVQDDRPLGFIGLIDGFIGGLFVDPAAHGHGIGRALVQHAHARTSPLTLDVYALNHGAIGFYRRLGFTEVERRPMDDEGHPFAVVRLRLD